MSCSFQQDITEMSMVKKKREREMLLTLDVGGSPQCWNIHAASGEAGGKASVSPTEAGITIGSAETASRPPLPSEPSPSADALFSEPARFGKDDEAFQ